MGDGQTPDKLAPLVGRWRRLGVSAGRLSVFMLTKENQTGRDEHGEHKQLSADGQN